MHVVYIIIVWKRRCLDGYLIPCSKLDVNLRAAQGSWRCRKVFDEIRWPVIQRVIGDCYQNVDRNIDL